MKGGVENRAIGDWKQKISFKESKNEDVNDLWKPTIQSCYFRHLTWACHKNKVTYSTVKYKHFWAVLVYYAKSLEKAV